MNIEYNDPFSRVPPGGIAILFSLIMRSSHAFWSGAIRTGISTNPTFPNISMISPPYFPTFPKPGGATGLLPTAAVHRAHSYRARCGSTGSNPVAPPGRPFQHALFGFVNSAGGGPNQVARIMLPRGS